MTGFLRNNALLGAAEILARLPLILTAGLLARGMGPDMFGNWVLVLVVQTFVVAIAGLGLSSSISRLASSAAPEMARGYLWLAVSRSMIMLALLSGIVLAFHKPLAVLLGVAVSPSQLFPLAFVLAITAVLEGILNAIFKARLALRHQFAFLAARTTIEVIVILAIFGISSSGVHPKPLEALTQFVIVSTALKILAYAALAIFPRQKRTALPGDLRQSFIRFGLPMIPTALVVWFVSQGNRAILGQFVSLADLGIFAFAATLAGYLYHIGSACYPLLLPYASRAYDSQNHEQVVALFLSSQWIAIALLFPCLVGLTLLAPEIIRFTAGDQFANAARYIPLLAYAISLEIIIGVQQYVFYIVKKPRIIMYLSILNALLLLLFVSVAGMVGIESVPIAFVMAAALFNGVTIAVARRYFMVPFVQVAAAMAAMLLAVLVLMNVQDWPALFRLAIALGVAVIAIPALFKARSYTSSQQEA